MEARHRKGKSSLNSHFDDLGDGDGDGLPCGGGVVTSRNTRGEFIDKAFTRAILALVGAALGVAVLVFFGLHEPLLAIVGLREAAGTANEHVVVVDAGSTGTRVLGFTFKRSPDGRLELHDELWKQVKPGLSSYAEDPSAATEGLTQLMDAARERIPAVAWPSTPVTLKATAGLRLLPKEKSQAILERVRSVLEGSGFKPEEKLIEIMNPLDEGLFGWFTVNFLLRQFDGEGGELGSSFASLDLGGGSTQITFAPRRAVAGVENRKHFSHSVSLMGSAVQLYSHSYLGLGLIAARESIVKAENPEAAAAAREPLHVQLSCLTSDTPKNWSYNGQDYVVSRRMDSSSSLEECSRAVTEVIGAGDVHRPEELKERSVAAFSYFFDLANEHGYVPEGRLEAVVAVRDFHRMATKACTPQGRGFNCHDLVFIYTLLTRGYGLPDDKEVHLYKKIAGHEASWALGLAYNILQAK